MAGEKEVQAVGANIPDPSLNGPTVAGSVDFREKYAEERSKRLNPQGQAQYVDLRQSDKYKQFLEDPWIPSGTPINDVVPDGGHIKFVIVGGGWGGILAAVKLIQAGFQAKDIMIVEIAGGFGGTWYWNRYPGLMCDVESYIYLPLLEEMDYIPKRRYSSGYEILSYAEMVCSKYGLNDRAMFQSSTKTAEWDEKKGEWNVRISNEPKGGQKSERTIHAEFIMFSPGVLNSPKMPDATGINDFKGYMFHTSRWDYNFTGGTPENPALEGLKGKKVAFVGTGPTAIQAVPHLAKYAKELYVFQRTPSSVDARNNHDTDEATFKKEVATGKGWWRARNANFNAFLQDYSPKPEVNLVNDQWSHMPSFSALIGGPKQVGMENVADHVEYLHATDAARQEEVRQRVNEIVKDPATAKDLQAWYPGWCKRPCFHDEYLPSFNEPNVHLVDTKGQSVNNLSEKGIVLNGKEYEVDVILWGTGFRSPIAGSPAGKTDTVVKGRNGQDIEEVQNNMELFTLHGVLSRGFPNLFYIGVASGGAITANFMFVLDNLSTHIAYIISTAVKNSKSQDGKVVIEPSHEAQEAWADRIVSGAATFAGMAGCTPSYFNLEGMTDQMPPEMQMKAARAGAWPDGLASYLDIVESWRADGNLQGLEVSAVA